MKGFLKKGSKGRSKKKVRLEISPLMRQMLVGLLLIVGVALLLYGVWYVTRIPALQVGTIHVVGGETIPHARIEEKVNTALSGTYFALIPKRFLPLYPKDSIIENIRTINRVKNIHVERTEDQSLTVIFDEHVPYALWCEKEDSVTCLFIDRTGYAFAPAPSLEGSAFVRYVGDETVPSVGTTGFESLFVKDTEVFTDLLRENLSLYVTHIHKMGDYDVEYTISGGGVIKVSQSIPMQKSFENLQTILLSPEFEHIEPGSFQYIDLRFGEKIFVNEAGPATQASTTEPTPDPF